jgi:hypothetical protein
VTLFSDTATSLGRMSTNVLWSRTAFPLAMMWPGKLPAQGRMLHRSQKPGALWYGYMLGDWSTRYLPGGMLAVAQPFVGWLPTPKTPLLP